MAVITGNNNSQILVGTLGADTITGGGGNDTILAGLGDDYLDGGSGVDTLFGDLGNDRLVFRMADHGAATTGIFRSLKLNDYDGGLGQDTLRLVFTRDEWLRADVQTDIANYRAFLTAEPGKLYNLIGNEFNGVFTFAAFDLKVTRLEALEIMVDGVLIDSRDRPVTVVADRISATEDSASVAFNVLANDSVPNLVKTVTFTQAAHGVVTMPTSNYASATAPTANLVYTPNATYYQYLAAGESATDTFTYTVTDADNDTATTTVTVTITGANDGPLIVSGTTTTALTEDAAATLTGTGTIVFSDVDLTDTHTVSVGAARTTVSGNAPANFAPAAGFGTLTAIVNEVTTDQNPQGNLVWTFTANNAQVQGLAAGQTATQVYTLTLTDRAGATVTRDVTVTLTGTNDAPTIAAQTSAGAVVEDAATTATGTFTFADVDIINTHSVAVAARGTGYLGGLTATIADTATGDGAGIVRWNFAVDNSQIQNLAQGETLTQSYNVTVTDNNGGTAVQIVTVTITGTNDAPVAVADVASATEDGAIVTGSVAINDSDVDHGATRSYALAAPVTGLTMAADGSYRFDPGAGPYQSIAQGQTRNVVASYVVTDDKGATATSTLTVTVTGVNDQPFANLDRASATEGGAIVTGSVATNDGDVDAGSTLTYALFGPPVEGLTLSADGSYRFDPGHPEYARLSQGQIDLRTAVYTVTDEHGAWTSSVLQIFVTGTNTAPVITSGGPTTVVNFDQTGRGNTLTAYSEDGLVFTPRADTVFSFGQDRDGDGQGELGMNVANFEIRSASGTMFTLSDFDLLYSGGTTVTLQGFVLNRRGDEYSPAGPRQTVTAAGHVTLGSGFANVDMVQVVGNSWIFDNFRYGLTNGGGSVYEVADGSLDENVVTSALNGRITFTDEARDSHTAGFVANGANYLGTFALGTPGNGSGALAWHFQVPDADLNYLAQGQTLTQSYTVTVTDDGGASASQVVTISLIGTNDAPVVTSVREAAIGRVQEAGTGDGGRYLPGTVSVTSKLTGSDADTGSAPQWSGSPGGGTYGNFWIGQGGLWTYQLDDERPATQALRGGQSVTESFVARLTDEYGAFADQPITITVYGANDAPSATNLSAAETYIEDTPLNLIDIVASDVDAAPLTATLRLDNAAAGSLSTGTSGAVTATYNATTGEWRASGATADVNALLAGVTFNPTVNFNGNFNILTAVSDGEFTVTGSKALTGTAVPDAPIITSGAEAFNYSVRENGINSDGSPRSGGFITSFLSASDPDSAYVRWTPTTGNNYPIYTNYAYFRLGPGGQWDYYPLNNTPAVQALREGEIVTETFLARITDDTGLFAERLITATLIGTNDAPVVSTPLVDQNPLGGSQISYTFAANSFTDVDHDSVLSYSATLAGGGTLPSWLTFDAATRSFSGTLPANQGRVDVVVIADDGLGGRVSGNFAITPVVQSLSGGNGAENFTGTAASERIVGGGGDDTLRGDSGSDLIYGDGSVAGGALTATAQSYYNGSNAFATATSSGSSVFGSSVGNGESITVTDAFPNGLHLGSGSFETLLVSHTGRFRVGTTSFQVWGGGFVDLDAIGPVTSAGGNSTGTNRVYANVDSSNHVVTITWDDVRPALISSEVNAMQVQLVDRGSGDFDVIYRLETVQWGLSYPGVQNSAGYNLILYGDVTGETSGVDRTPGNTGSVGYYLLQVRDGQFIVPGNDLIDGGPGSDTMTGGEGFDTFVFRPGEANGDVVTDFTGNGTAAGDTLRFEGFGVGAAFSMIDATHGTITYNGGAAVETITFTNAPTIVPADIIFG